MAKTFQQPDKKETPTQKLKRELAEAEAQRDGYQKEASHLRQQISARLEDIDSYKNLVKQVNNLTLQRNLASKQRDQYKAQLQERDAELAELKSQLAALQNVENRSASNNPFGAGRKLAYAQHADQIKQLRNDGLSVRKIAETLNIPSATVARYLKVSK